MESDEEHERTDRTKALRSRTIAFVVVSVGAIIFLLILGATPVLILEVFGLAIILALGAAAALLLFGRSPRMR